MSNYDPTSPKVSDDFLARDGEDDVTGHVSPTEQDAGLGTAEGVRARAAADEDDVEGHVRAAYAVPTDEPESLRSRAVGDEDDVEGHFRAAFADQDPEAPDGMRSRTIAADEDEDVEGHRASWKP